MLRIVVRGGRIFAGVDAGSGLLDRMRSAGGDANRWVESFDGFLNEWGWRTEPVADPLSPSWIEDPGPVLGSIGSMLMAGEQPDFDAKRKAAEDEREAALEAVRSHGALYGSWLAAKRLARCHPWGGHGHDPVPAKLRH